MSPGFWTGNIYYFTPPVIYLGKTLHQIDLTGAELDEGITGEDVIQAILNPLSDAELRLLQRDGRGTGRTPTARQLRTTIRLADIR